jgi:hypothetical protein
VYAPPDSTARPLSLASKTPIPGSLRRCDDYIPDADAMSRRAGHRRPIDADRFVVQAAVQRVGHFRGVEHDGAVEVKWSDVVSDDFAHNFIHRRVEGRFGVSVNQPGAIVKVATAA